jgi:dTDP-glucose 4,6-dehydratase
MTYLITGGCGFIGSAFIRYWLNKYPDDKIVNLDALTYAGNQQNLEGFSSLSNYQFVHGNILDGKLVYGLMLDANAVIHFAAESHVTRSEDAPDTFLLTNVLGTRTLLDTAVLLLERGHLVEFVHISTDEVYGPITDGFFKEEDFRPDLATSSYAVSKSRADQIARSCPELPTIVVRPTNNFGPFQYPEKALPRWITNALLDKPIKVWGPGNQIRDWLYVLDTCEALDMIIHEAKSGSVFNIGANLFPEITNLEMAHRILEILGKPASLVQIIPNPRPDHDERYGVDTARIQSLGWKPGNFQEQLQNTVYWYGANPQWWRPLKEEAESLYRDKEKS